MADSTPITDEELASEFRLLGLSGKPSDALNNPAIRTCLTACAELRKRRTAAAHLAQADLKRRAAGDND